MKNVLFLICALFFCSNAIAEQYLCIPSYSEGFSNRSGTWKAGSIPKGTLKYTLKKEKDGFKWRRFGEERILLDCSHMDNEGYVSCARNIVFNSKSLRYQFIKVTGYVIGRVGDPASDMMFFEIGKCSRL